MQIFLFKALVFLASFLLFQIELILGKLMLPGFGGGYLVWGISMVVYQGLLLLGYVHLHLLNRYFRIHRFSKWQGSLLLASLFLFPIHAEYLQNPLYQTFPALEIVFLLGSTIGFFFFLLAGLSIYAQLHLAASGLPENENPFILYASSNLGAFTSLLTYPFLLEPNFDTYTQLLQWQIGYGTLVFLFFIIHSVISFKTKPHQEPITFPPSREASQWLLLSAAPSALFLAVTNQITFDIAPVPLLWIFPLAIYLLTLFLSFKQEPFCPQWILNHGFLAMAVGLFLFLLKSSSYSLFGLLVNKYEHYHIRDFTSAVIAEPLLQLGICFIGCLVCHYRLSQIRPTEPGRLTVFYLILAVGGFLGGVIVNWIVPLLFNSMVEEIVAFILAAGGLHLVAKTYRPISPYQLLFILASLIAIMLLWPDYSDLQRNEIQASQIIYPLMAILILMYLIKNNYRYITIFFCIVVLLTPILDGLNLKQDLLFQKRNFYGIHKVYDKEGFRFLKHGNTLHGAQFLDATRTKEALTYYHSHSPMGEYLTQDPFQDSHIALIGLGAGSLATYSKPGQHYDFFELDPLIGKIARTYFTFLSDAHGTLRMVYGDARLMLRKEPAEKYDAMIIDVFNSGAIPVHLLTVDAIREFRRTLKPDGIIFFHISNQFIDLVPVLYANAQILKMHPSIKSSSDENTPQRESTLWLALMGKVNTYATLLIRLGWETANPPPAKPWTDRSSSLISQIH